MKKFLTSLTLIVTLCFTLCGCGIKEEVAIGTWSSSIYYNENKIDVSFVVSPNGEYGMVTYINDELNKHEEGTWIIEGGKLIFQVDGDPGQCMEFEYKDGYLFNGKHKYSKNNFIK